MLASTPELWPITLSWSFRAINIHHCICQCHPGLQEPRKPSGTGPWPQLCFGSQEETKKRAGSMKCPQDTIGTGPRGIQTPWDLQKKRAWKLAKEIQSGRPYSVEGHGKMNSDSQDTARERHTQNTKQEDGGCPPQLASGVSRSVS